MSLYDYRESQDVAQEGFGFYALLMTLMRNADDINLEKLRSAWPEVWAELTARYHAPGGMLPGEAAPEDDDSFDPSINGGIDEELRDDDVR